MRAQTVLPVGVSVYSPSDGTKRGDDVQAGQAAAERAFTPDRQRRAGVGYRDDDLVGSAFESDIEATAGVTQRILGEDGGDRAGYRDLVAHRPRHQVVAHKHQRGMHAVCVRA